MKTNDEHFRPWLSLQGASGLVQKAVGDDKNEAANFLVQAATGIVDAAAKIQEVVPQILGNKLGSALSNSQAARKAISKLTEPALKKVETAINFAHAAIESLTKQSDPKTPTDVVAAVQHQEVRSALLRMSTPERNKAITTALASGDETFLAAATSGSPTLSGMRADEQKAAREKWRKTRHPDTAAKIAHLSNGIAQLARISPMLKKWSDALVAEPSAMALAAADASAAAAEAASS